MKRASPHTTAVSPNEEPSHTSKLPSQLTDVASSTLYTATNPTRVPFATCTLSQLPADEVLTNGTPAVSPSIAFAAPYSALYVLLALAACVDAIVSVASGGTGGAASYTSSSAIVKIRLSPFCLSVMKPPCRLPPHQSTNGAVLPSVCSSSPHL